jgi:glycosyltransferase involved in cell wall biosynthesis
MKISFFFRQPSPVFHSIEEQFFAIQKQLRERVEYKNIFAKYPSKGFFKRILITFQAAFNQGDINHITGDINFIALFLRKKKTILTIHDIGSALNKSWLPRFVIRLFWFVIPFIRVKYITAISEFSKTEILKEFKLKPEKIIVIPDCISDEFIFSKKEFNSEKPVILQIGTKPNKNISRIIEAISEINCTLIIVGKISENDTNLLTKYRIEYENKVNLDYSEIVKLYRNCDLVTFVSTYEGFGVPILEAQATGRPVLTSNLSPMNEVAGNGAIFVNPFDVSEIRKAIIKIISDENLRNEIIGNGTDNVKKYSAKSIAEQYYNLYKKL